MPETSSRPAPVVGVVSDTSMPTLEVLAEFATAVRYEDLPDGVVHESRRILLDSIGCALAGVHSDKGRWGIGFVRACHGGPPQATVIGTGGRVSALGAAFANAELINGLDHDVTSFTSPGHVSPFVIPPLLAVAEQRHLSGRAFLTAFAIAHEMAERVGGGV